MAPRPRQRLVALSTVIVSQVHPHEITRPIQDSNDSRRFPENRSIIAESVVDMQPHDDLQFNASSRPELATFIAPLFVEVPMNGALSPSRYTRVTPNDDAKL